MNGSPVKGKYLISKWLTWTVSTIIGLITIFLIVFNFGQSIGGHQVEFVELTEEVFDFKAAFQKHCEDNNVLFNGITSAANAQREYQHKMEIFMTKIDGRLKAIEEK